ncbi:MAG: multidrug effflux MFS transporter [Alphaproteobacteria bacterium]|nr:multidrug effflux MFS transporter [Alphaproteobacteria bacterium]
MRTADRPPLRPGEFVPLIALLMSLVALAIDAMLPALPAIGRDLGAARPNDVQFVITAAFLGLGLGQMIFGPLSDRIGRRPAINIGLALFAVGCLMSLFAPDFETMLAGRVLQGFGAAGPRVVVMALVRDQYEGSRMARILSFTMAVFILVPAVAPALGQAVQWLGGWRAIFAAFLAGAGVAFAWFALRQPETLPPARRRPFSPRAIGGGVLEVLRIRASLGYTLATGFVFAAFVTYLSCAQQVFQEAYTTGALFPLYFALLALAIGAASLANGRLVMKYGMQRLVTAATMTMALVSAAAWAAAFAFGGLPPFWLFIACLFAVFLCIGLLFGNLIALAMEPLGHIAGVGSAVVTSLSTFISIPFGAAVALSFDGTIYPLTAAFAVFGAAAWAAIRWVGRT